MSVLTVLPFRAQTPPSISVYAAEVRAALTVGKRVGVLRDWSNDASSFVVNIVINNWLGSTGAPSYVINPTPALGDLRLLDNTGLVIVSTPLLRKGTVLYDQAVHLAKTVKLIAPATANAAIVVNPSVAPCSFNPRIACWFNHEIEVRPASEVEEVVAIACEEFADGQAIRVAGVTDDEVKACQCPVSGVSIWKWYDYISRYEYAITDNVWFAQLFAGVRGSSCVHMCGGPGAINITSNLGAVSSGWVTIIRRTARKIREAT